MTALVSLWSSSSLDVHFNNYLNYSLELPCNPHFYKILSARGGDGMEMAEWLGSTCCSQARFPCRSFLVKAGDQFDCHSPEVSPLTNLGCKAPKELLKTDFLRQDLWALSPSGSEHLVSLARTLSVPAPAMDAGNPTHTCCIAQSVCVRSVVWAIFVLLYLSMQTAAMLVSAAHPLPVQVNQKTFPSSGGDDLAQNTSNELPRSTYETQL